MDNIRNYNGLIGKTFSRVYTSINWNGEKAELIFEKENGDKCIFYHDQDCCESVTIKEIVGELSDLENSPILKAEEFTEEGVGKNGRVIHGLFISLPLPRVTSMFLGLENLMGITRKALILRRRF
jgi:hypothetical protein